MGKTDSFEATIRERFARIASSPDQAAVFPDASTIANSLGYDIEEIQGLPASATESFCGVGNPLALGHLRVGDTVLDLGSGAGMDSILAARQVGPTGKVIGVDMTEAMVRKARSNAAVLGLTNVEFIHARLENLPLDDESVDVAISNGTFNLCRDKPKALAEVFRVLRPGGRVQMADILLHDEVTQEEVASKGAWST